MMNLIRMNLYRFLRMKSVYVLLAIFSLFGILFVVNAKEGAAEQAEQTEQIQVEEQESGKSLVGAAPAPTANTDILEYVMETAAGGFMLIFLSIYIAILACGERDCGFLKNLNSCSLHKWMIVCAKLVPATIFIILEFLVQILIMAITNIVLQAGMVMGNMQEFLVCVSIQILLHLAFAVLMLTVIEISRSLLVSVIIGMVISCGILFKLTNLLENALQKLLHVNLPLAENTIVGRISCTIAPYDFSVFSVSIAVGVVALIAYTIISCVIFKKRDIY